MTAQLLAALRRLAEARGYKSPDLILAEHEARQPRRPFEYYWRKQ